MEILDAFFKGCGLTEPCQRRYFEEQSTRACAIGAIALGLGSGDDPHSVEVLMLNEGWSTSRVVRDNDAHGRDYVEARLRDNPRAYMREG